MGTWNDLASWTEHSRGVSLIIVFLSCSPLGTSSIFLTDVTDQAAVPKAEETVAAPHNTWSTTWCYRNDWWCEGWPCKMKHCSAWTSEMLEKAKERARELTHLSGKIERMYKLFFDASFSRRSSICRFCLNEQVCIQSISSSVFHLAWPWKLDFSSSAWLWAKAALLYTMPNGFLNRRDYFGLYEQHERLSLPLLLICT